MAALTGIIRRQIGLQGPITVAQYMELCLAHPDHGYYRKQDPFGRGGDFVTAPEISQMFGELLGLWVVAAWQDLGEPAPFTLAELGPGRGTLMADALRAAAQVPAFDSAARLHLVETSPVLRARQSAALDEARPVWHDDVTTLPDGPMIVLANEFFDALPIRQFQRTADGWHERLVGLAANDALRFTLSPPQLINPLVPDSLKNAPIGSLVEICPAGLTIAGYLAERVVSADGAALIIDYGHPASAPGETLQAVKDQAYHDPLADPGDADLTAHVDFGALAGAAKAMGARVYGPRGQGAFLDALGLRVRAEALAATATDSQRADIAAALDRLTGPDAMGTLFKVMAITGSEMAPPAGFA